MCCRRASTQRRTRLGVANGFGDGCATRDSDSGRTTRSGLRAATSGDSVQAKVRVDIAAFASYRERRGQTEVQSRGTECISRPMRYRQNCNCKWAGARRHGQIRLWRGAIALDKRRKVSQTVPDRPGPSWNNGELVNSDRGSLMTMPPCARDH